VRKPVVLVASTLAPHSSHSHLEHGDSDDGIHQQVGSQTQTHKQSYPFLPSIASVLMKLATPSFTLATWRTRTQTLAHEHGGS
jgi:hypothetical protein